MLFRRGRDLVTGFRTTRKLFKIVFEPDHELHGLEITVKGATLGERRAYTESFPNGASTFEKLQHEAEHFLSFVVEWNLEDEDGNPLPISYDAFEKALPFEWITPVISAYTRGSLGQKTPADTEKKSGSGDSTGITPRTEESLPMEPLQ